MITPWEDVSPFEPGTTIRADAMNFKLSGIATNLSALSTYLNGKVLNFAEDFTGNPYLPSGPHANSVLWINLSGNADYYSMTVFDQKVIDTANAASAAAASAAAALVSEQNARASELEAAASAEIAQTAAGAVAGTMNVSGTWNASTGNFPGVPEEGSTVWYASTDGTGATAAAKAGDLLIYDPINATWRLYAGITRVVAAEAAIVANNNALAAQLADIQAIALAGLD